MKNLGDKIEKVASAVGIKPCEGCKKRKGILNDWSRRGFVGVVGGLFAAAGLSARKLGWQLAGNVDVTNTLNLSRLINMVQRMNFEATGSYFTTEGLLARLAKVKAKGTGFASLTPSLS